MSSEQIALDSESSGEQSPNSLRRSLILGLPANSGAAAEVRSPVIRRGRGSDIGQLGSNILELATEGLRKVSNLRFHHERLQSQLDELSEAVNHIETVLEDMKEYSLRLRR